jgi:5'-nucleotidase
MEGRFLGCPAIAFSLAGESSDYKSAVLVVKKVIQSLIKNPLEEILLNINIPDVNYDSIEGYEVTRLGNRHKSEPAIETHDPKGRKVYWVGEVGAERDAGKGTDFYAIRKNKVSITPMHIDLTKHQFLSTISNWIEVLN